MIVKINWNILFENHTLNLKKNVLLPIYLLGIINVMAQTDQNTIIPQSPEISTLLRFQNLPTGTFTGVPDITFPLVEVKSRSFRFPLAISYHAGGNKVEDISSNIGLGWALTGLPTISRSINHLPDESAGFLSEAEEYTIEEKISNVPGSLNSATSSARNLRTSIANGSIDTEADIFRFNLKNKSGTFYWNQSLKKFVVSPKSNIKVISNHTLSSFIIIDEDGSQYHFATKNSNTPNGGQLGSTVITSWLVDKVVDANNTDEILFHYSAEYHQISSVGTQKRTLWGSKCSYSVPVISSSINLVYNINEIISSECVVSFEYALNNRSDLNGSKALDKIKVKNQKDEVLKILLFRQKYVGNGNNYEDKRLLLESFSEMAIGSQIENKYQFFYNESIPVPSRLSFSQDYWGYYNNSTNTDLIPSMNIPILGQNHFFSGADRSVNPLFNQFSILNKIVYPTGGSTEFYYESNTTAEEGIPGLYNTMASSIDIDEPLFESFEKKQTFSIDETADPLVNSSNPSGGANVTIQLTGLQPSCNYTILLKGVGLNNSHINTSVTYNYSTWLPNGEYEMDVSIANGGGVDLAGFSFLISWKGKGLNTSSTKYVGGLRVAEMRQNDNFKNLRIRKFKYSKAFDSDESSGQIFGIPYFIGIEDYYSNCSESSSNVYSIDAFAGSSINQVSHSGSFIGYESVFEFDFDGLNTGVTQYKYTVQKDIVSGISPFPPSQTSEYLRGRLKELSFFEMKDGVLKRIRKEEMTYDIRSFLNENGSSVKLRRNSDWYFEDGIQSGPPFYDYVTYNNEVFWCELQSKKIIEYDITTQNPTMSILTDYEYDPVLLKWTKEKTYNSKSQYAEEEIKYLASNFTNQNLTAIESTAKARNIYDLIAWKKRTLNASLLQQVVYEFDLFTGTTVMMLLPKKTSIYSGNGHLIDETKFEKYNSYGKTIEVTSQSGVVSYKWDAQSNYPLAEFHGSLHLESAYSSFEDVSQGGFIYPTHSIVFNKGISGEYAFSLSSGSISKSGLISIEKYSLQYWSRQATPFTIPGTYSSNSSLTDTDGWYFHQHKITGINSLNITGVGLVDEISFCPIASATRSFVYKPSVGIVAAFNERGGIAFYEYDPFNRLKLIKDQNGNIVKQFCYNYANQLVNCYITEFKNNEPYSGQFTRNNCPAGYTGGTVTYTVPANTVASTISEADANAKAQQKVLDEGQVFANVNGTCTPVVQPGPCSLTVFSPVYFPTYSLSSNGTQTTGYMVVWLPNALTMGSTVSIGAFSAGGCKPSSNRYQTVSSGGRTFSVTYASNGTISLQLLSGGDLPPQSTLSLSVSFNL